MNGQKKKHFFEQANQRLVLVIKEITSSLKNTLESNKKIKLVDLRKGQGFVYLKYMNLSGS